MDASAPADQSVVLDRMESATNYNAWLGRRFREHLGRRVLEVGAGTGTITAQIAGGRELVVALELERAYVEKLRERFRHVPNVRPWLSDAAIADVQQLREERIDSVLLSNVLEHIPDDGAAVRRFREILPSGGKLVLFVPAIQQLFGTMDEAVGHQRRYTPATLRAVLEQNGFRVQVLEWMNVAGIPGWFLNGKIFRRRHVPQLQLKVYDAVAPLLARLESRVRLPIGMSLFAVGEAV